MSVRAAELIHVGNSILIDRLQQAGPANLNQNVTTIYELGDYESLDRIRDIPDYTMPMQSFDARAQMEAILLGLDYDGMADGHLMDISEVLPLDVLGEYKKGKTNADPFGIRAGVILPQLYTESIQYRYGLRQNAAQTVNLRGDQIGWNDASAYEETFTGSGAAGQACALTHGALPYNGDSISGTKYAFSVSLASGKRLFLGADYTETTTGSGQAKTATVHVIASVPNTDKIRITYFSPTVAEYPQVSHAPASAVAPAAIRGKDIEVRIGGTDVADRWSGVQSVQWNWTVTLDRDEEFGNPLVVSQDFDVPDVGGTINIKPRDMADFLARIRQITGVASGETAGPNVTNPVPAMVTLHSPVTGKAIKSLFTPDAVFDLPGYNQQVQTKFTQDMTFASQSGQFYVVKNGFVDWDGTDATGVADS
jgi:hypothetical protein